MACSLPSKDFQLCESDVKSAERVYTTPCRSFVNLSSCFCCCCLFVFSLCAGVFHSLFNVFFFLLLSNSTGECCKIRRGIFSPIFYESVVKRFKPFSIKYVDTLCRGVAVKLVEPDICPVSCSAGSAVL